MEWLSELLVLLATMAALVGLAPVVAGCFQALVTGYSVIRTHLHRTGRYLPRITILIPAWNEELVLEPASLGLLALDYPEDRLRLVIIDDASTDDTPVVARSLVERFPDRVVHLRREKGGQGKAATLNHALERVIEDGWSQAVMITDADVQFAPDALKLMARHLADPEVGAVTAYIQEGTARPTWVQRYVRFEYVTASACSRRAQNYLGWLACLSGGAQLHSVENLRTLGGYIRHQTFAEDTHMTLLTQLAGRRAVFEPGALCHAHEPDTLQELWKQRKRWQRGNYQLSWMFRWLWLRPSVNPMLGSFNMALVWFSVLLTPALMFLTSAGLVTLQVLAPMVSVALFKITWLLSGLTYLVTTLVAWAADPKATRTCWFEGLAFPGIISLALITMVFLGPILAQFGIPDLTEPEMQGLLLAGNLWLAGGVVLAFAAQPLEKAGLPRLAFLVVLITGYGAYLAANSLAALWSQLRGAQQVWHRTEKKPIAQIT